MLLMSEVIHSLLGNVNKKASKLFYGKRDMVHCKTLIQHFPSWKQKSPPIRTRFGW